MSELALRFQELTDLLAPLQYAELKKIAAEFNLDIVDAISLYAEWDKAN
jgi:hypothetical protein